MTKVKFNKSGYSYLSYIILVAWPLLFLFNTIIENSNDLFNSSIRECLLILALNFITVVFVTIRTSSSEMSFFDGLDLLSYKYSSGCANITLLYLPLFHFLVFLIMFLVALIGIVKDKQFTEYTYIKLISSFTGESAEGIFNTPIYAYVSLNSKQYSSFVTGLIFLTIIAVTCMFIFLPQETSNQQNKQSKISSIIYSTRTPITQIPVDNSNATPQPIKVSREEIDPWRIEPIKNYDSMIFDTTSDEKWNEFVAHHARNLAIAAPYKWEIYSVKGQISFNEVSDYYTNKGKNKLFRIARNEYNPEINMGLISLVQSPAYIYIQYWEADGDSPASILVFYKNVDS